jgi:hypothetical protein
MIKRRFSCRLASDEITTCGYKTLTFAKCITIMITELTVMSSLGFSRDSMVWYGMVWDIFWCSPCRTV